MGASPPPAAGPSLAGRFAAAIALTIGFYVLALAIAGGLLAVAILPWILSGHGNLWVSLTGLVLGVSILAAIVPRRHPFNEPGVLVTNESQPGLLGVVDAEAHALGDEAPDEVYVNFEANAAVTEVGRGRRVMIIGLPLLHLLSEEELRGVVAHEFGHYAGGDTRLGPWIYRTRQTIGRTLDHLTDDDGDDGFTQTVVRAPFEWYGKAFMRITSTISRREEFAADRIAVGRTGRDVYAGALRRIHAYAPAFDAYWEQEVVPVLEQSRRPPVASGFAAFVRVEAIERMAEEGVERMLREVKTDPYDSHPSLSQRLAALKDADPGAADDSAPAAGLVTDLPGLERDVFASLGGPDAAEALKPVDWSEVGTEVYLTRARSLAEAFPEVLEGVTGASLGEAVATAQHRVDAVRRREPDVNFEDAAGLVLGILRDGLLVALADNGWEVSVEIAEPVRCTRNGQELEPALVIGELHGGELDATAWAERARALGIAELALDAPPVAAGA